MVRVAVFALRIRFGLQPVDLVRQHRQAALCTAVFVGLQLQVLGALHRCLVGADRKAKRHGSKVRVPQVAGASREKQTEIDLVKDETRRNQLRVEPRAVHAG